MMENPYWHPYPKSHSIDLEQLKVRLFEIYNIFSASSGHQGLGMEYDDEDDAPEITPIDQLHFDLAEPELSKKLLDIAISVRVLDDIYAASELSSSFDDLKSQVEESHEMGIYFAPREMPDPKIRDLCNKIIHAVDVRPVYETQDDCDSKHVQWGMNWTLELEGTERGSSWHVTINMHEFLNALLALIDGVIVIQNK